MNDIVTRSYVEEFQNLFGFVDKSESEVFELFATYCILSKYTTDETISKNILEDVNIGNGNDWGIDSILIIINGKIVTTIEEAQDLFDANKIMNVSFVIIQSKSSPSFSVDGLSQVLDGTKYLFSEIQDKISVPPSNPDLDLYRQMVRFVYSKSASFYRGLNPSLDVYYASCGITSQNPDFKAKIDFSKQEIRDLGLLHSVECYLLGRKELVNLYKTTKNRVEAEIYVEQKIAFPEMRFVNESYLCLLPFSEFRKLILDNNNELINSVFYDNVRAYQGENTVNKAMSHSLQNGDLDLFAVMNNGITIISRDIRTIGRKFHLTDYQVVNGCQTCNVLYRNLALEDIDSLILTVKLIASDDKNVRDKIIVANNSQTEVKREQLLSLLETQKNIEDYYNAQNKFDKLYYERRSKQYQFNETQIPAYKVVTIPSQIKSFVAMIIGEPHRVGGYYGSIIEQFDKNGVKVFASDTNPALYYTSALAYYKMSEAFSSKEIHSKYKKVKFHLLFALRLMCENTPLPHFNSKNIDKYCDHICTILCDSEKCRIAFQAATNVIDKVLKTSPKDADRLSSVLTDNIKELVRIINEKKKNICSC